MKNTIKIAIIGGTGKSGRYLVKQLLHQGIPFKILVRNPTNFQIKDPLIEVVNGDVKNYEDVYSLINGCSAVISTLGLGLPASETSIFSKASTNIIRAMNECNVKRYIVITGLNVDTSFDKKGPATMFGTNWMKTNYPKSTADKQLEYDILLRSNINWTLVRLPLIELTDERNEVNVSLEDCIGDKISATDLAHFLIEQVHDKAFINQSPFIANP
ncbi:NAD(P)-dependent oxidoreductase [Albibacterium bauzanense]|nr:NAD(P)H-binding protein [Albibacterium bauzanense]